MLKKKVAIIDYGVGNLLSIKRAFEKIDSEVVVTSKFNEILNSSYVVLPGVGAFGKAMQSIKKYELFETIQSVAKKGKPLLGICLGAQLLLSESEEFETNYGLDIIKGKVVSINKYIKDSKKLKIPHIGWCEIEENRNESLNDNVFFKCIDKKDTFYFVHSFMCEPNDTKNILYKVNHDGINLTAMVGIGNVYGCQFHPEKSGESGLKLLSNFLKLK
tara:strand:- start:356 stop:1006 length:651 start_codon:yes stop_codon:yes gene_type:complete